jgi:hypothetical protein
MTAALQQVGRGLAQKAADYEDASRFRHRFCEFPKLQYFRTASPGDYNC